MIPLSTKMRPSTLDGFVGQTHFLFEGSLFYNSIKNKTFDSAIFFGPSGTGKTTLARIIARELDSNFVEINASVTGTKELKTILQNASDRFYGLMKETTCLYVDEVHRWNKLQQDSLLKAIEEGVIKFIGSTTENPYFSVNNAILSRVRNIYEFKRLSPNDIMVLLKRTLEDTDKGFGALQISYDENALRTLAETVGSHWIRWDSSWTICQKAVRWILKSWRKQCRDRQRFTIRKKISTTFYRLCRNLCEEVIRMLRFIIWHDCFTVARMLL